MIFTTLPSTSSSRLTCSPTLTPFKTSEVMTDVDSLLCPRGLDRHAQTPRVNRLDRAAGYRARRRHAGSSLRLIGPIASMKESQHTDHVVMANVFIRIFFIRIFLS